MLSQQLLCIMVCIHQSGAHIIHKPGPDLYIADWVSRNNHKRDKDQEITGININVNAINTAVNMPVRTSIKDIQIATHEVAYLEKLKS